VSGYKNKADLDRQAERFVAFCAANGWTVEQVVKEVASGMNDKRPKLTKLLEQKPGRLVVEHKDRLTRFGFNYFDLLLPKLGCELVVINRDAEEQADLMKDMVAVVTSFFCRIYGLRHGINKVKALKEICSAP
jgi:predicted site-specific integrase-resolvase